MQRTTPSGAGGLSGGAAPAASAGRTRSPFGSWQPLRSEDYRRALEARGIVASMSRTGDFWDNAVAESFFAAIKAELIQSAPYDTRSGATESIGEYIDNFYNPQRRHSHLG